MQVAEDSFAVAVAGLPMAVKPSIVVETLTQGLHSPQLPWALESASQHSV